MPDFTLDESFDRTYDIEFLNEYPNTSEPTFRVRGEQSWIGRLNPIVRIRPYNAPSWIAILPAPGRPRLYTCPDPAQFLVATTIVRCTLPVWSHSITYHDEATLPVQEIGAIIVADHSSLHAWTRNGIAWTARGVAHDGIRALRYSDGKILGEAWYPENDAWHAFSLDPTGAPNVRPIWLGMPPL